MQKRQIRMEDGRYLIFYTFEDEIVAQSGMDSEENPADSRSDEQPDLKPEATEERHV